MGPMDLDIFIENKKLISAFIWRFSGFKMTKTGNYIEEIIFQEVG